MKILAIASRLPYPFIDGARICTYQAIHAMATHGHDVHLVAIEEEGTDPGPLTDYATVHIIPHKLLPKILGALVTLFNRLPYTQQKKDLPHVYQRLDALQAEHRFDLVYADQAHIAQYGAYMKRKYGLPYMQRSHNIEHEIYRRHTNTVRNPFMRAYLELQYKRWARFETEQFRLADSCAAITERDRLAIERLAPDVITDTIPAAVDLDYFAYTPTEEREEYSVILLGNMAWEPNKDAAVWFANDILPFIRKHIPDVVCYLVGDNPPLKQLPPNSETFRIEGRVPSILPYYNRVTVGLVPLRVGGGMRVKMVEMMSAGLPVIITRQGAEGNMAAPEEHYIEVDDPVLFAERTVALLRDRAEQKRYSENARAFVEEHYSLTEIGRKYDRLLEAAVVKTQQKALAE